MRSYSIESLSTNKKDIEAFTYDMTKQKNYRRAMLLLNQLDVEQGEDILEEETPSLGNPVNLK